MFRRRRLREGFIDDDDEEYAVCILLEQPKKLPRKHGGSEPGKAPNKDRNFGAAHSQLVNDYFSSAPVYDENTFERRFRMPKSVFLRIHDSLTNNYTAFQQRRDATNKLGLSGLQKITAALRILAYGKALDEVDELCRIAESTAAATLKTFCRCVIESFGAEYLRLPTPADVQRLLDENAARGFPGMLGSIDCMKWEWALCPRAFAGQYKGREKKPTVVLEAVASQDLWIWHADFGVAGSNNDINVLQRSSLIQALLHGTDLTATYQINGTNRHQPYFLADGIYPSWSIFLKGFPAPLSAKEKLFTEAHSAARKDVERAFGVLQRQWRILALPARFWHLGNLCDVMYCCIILHNMIVESRRDSGRASVQEEPIVRIPVDKASLGEILDRWTQLEDEVAHNALRNDLVQHLWNNHGDLS